MSLLTTHNLAKAYGPDDIFDSIGVEIPQRARVALVGPNGAGKTTLLNLLVGLDIPSEGTISVARGTRVGFLPQRPELLGDHTLWDEQLTAFADLRAMEQELHDLASRLDSDPAALDRYGHLQEEFERAGGYTYEQRVRMVLQGLGFTVEQDNLRLAQLSGGQKTRALLARLLLESPDLLVLDEPTNHLDIEAVEWLEGFLKDFDGAVLAVSHDRYFMDAFATTIWELEFGTVETYRGNYSHYISQRQERHERRLKEFEAQQEFLAKEMEYIRRNMAGQNTRQAKGRLRRLETMQRNGRVIERPKGKRREMSLRFNNTLRSGDKVLMAENLAVGYPETGALFTIPEITLWRGETVGLIGPNGAGKSTFLKTVTEHLTPLAGAVRLGAAVKLGYFAQAHEGLNPAHTLIDEIYSAKQMPISAARDHLARYLFTNDDVFRTVGTLSGGERGRLALAKLALAGANLLLLDEPTNHLDIDSQEVLQTVIADFPGTVILVTHDRYLVDALATQIWAVRRGSFNVFEGSYKDYLVEREAKAQRAAAEAQAARKADSQTDRKTQQQATAKKHGLNPYQLQKRITAVEANIAKLEQAVHDITAQLSEASAAGDGIRAAQLGSQYNEAEAALHAAMTEWEQLVE
ncbi:MAG: ABC-F family ATP-binding cassette domain-containing protein [Anaerolineae bacterium]|nr:ABC-F family ATP-binding cassette domain-containing protein [Anaerolineae bacterium]